MLNRAEDVFTKSFSEYTYFYSLVFSKDFIDLFLIYIDF